MSRRSTIKGGGGGSGGGSAASTLTVTQANSFAVGDAVYFDGTVWAKAKANAAATLGVAIVSAASASSFTAQFSGPITGLSGLTAGQYYFVSDATAGALTTTEPTAATSYSNPVLLATSSTAGIVLPYRPSAVNASVPHAGPVNGGRLTLTSGTPVTTSDVTGATTVYWAPYQHGAITLWDGSNVQTIVSAEVSVALGTLTSGKNYDVFGYYNAGALALELGAAWTSDTARSTALAWANGLLCKSGDATRLYLGTFRTTSTTTTEDSQAKRFLFNASNRTGRSLLCLESTDSWTYTTATWRQANGATGNRVEVLRGLDQDAMTVSVMASWSATATPKTASVGVGMDSTSSPVSVPRAGSAGSTGSSSFFSQSNSTYKGAPGLGYHALNWLEYSETGGTTTWYGDAGTTYIQSGMTGDCLA